MRASTRGTKGPAWTEAEVSALRALLALDPRPTRVELSQAVGRPIKSIDSKITALRLDRVSGQAGVLFTPRFEVPTRRKDDDAGHVAGALAARPLGFPVAFIRYRRRAA